MLTTADLPRFELDGESYVRPDFAGRGLANVAPTVMQLLASRAANGLELPPLDGDVLPERIASGVKTVIVVVADGLGHLHLQREIERGNASNLGGLIARAERGDECVRYTPITSVPSRAFVAAGWSR